MTIAIVVLLGLLMMGVEQLKPGRQWPRVKHWWLRAAVVNALQAGAVFAAGKLWDPWFRAHRLWHADLLGDVGGAVVGYVVLAFIYYWWHRARHEHDVLWRWVHQLHHSPKRLEVITSFYKHPVELAANAFLSSVVMYLVVGLGPEAAAGATLLSGLAELFYHWNVKTPHWLGYLIQRPEMHCVHHQEGLHHFNYGDLPVFDMLFGTFHNPAVFDDRCGFGDDEERIGDMLRGHDVTTDTQPRRRFRLRFVALAVVGFLALFAHISSLPTLKGAALASAASPLPKVFTSHNGWETFSATFAIRVDDNAPITIDAERYQQLHGPYNRRNVFGAVMAYGPVLQSDPRARAMFTEVAQKAVCRRHGATALVELGIKPGDDVVIEYTTHDDKHVELRVPCDVDLDDKGGDA